MGQLEILLATAFLVVSSLLTWGYNLMNSPEHRYLSILFFAIAPIPLILVDMYYVAVTSDSFEKRAITTAIIGAISMISVIEQIRYVARKT